MKLMKENITLVICGAIILVALVFAFAPGVPFMAPALRTGVEGELTERYGKVETIKQMPTKLSLPSLPEVTSIPPQGWITAKGQMIKDMEAQQKQVDALAKKSNMENRYDEGAKAPLLP